MSENRSLQSATIDPDDTFRALARRPARDVYADVNRLMFSILKEENLDTISTRHPKIAEWLESEHWTMSELSTAYKRYLESLNIDFGND